MDTTHIEPPIPDGCYLSHYERGPYQEIVEELDVHVCSHCGEHVTRRFYDSNPHDSREIRYELEAALFVNDIRDPAAPTMIELTKAVTCLSCADQYEDALKAALKKTPLIVAIEAVRVLAVENRTASLRAKALCALETMQEMQKFIDAPGRTGVQP